MALNKVADIDPLRSFDVDEDEWADTVAGVRKEGKDEWDAYAPAVAAAILDGFLDNHLQTLGKFMRERYLFLKDRGEAPTYVPANSKNVFGGAAKRNGKSMGAAVEEAIASGEYPMLPPTGVQPTHNYEIKGPSYFTARGHTFLKRDFEGKHFYAAVPIDGGALYRIDKIARENAQVECVVSNTGQKVGRMYNFRLARQFNWYNIPPSA